MAETKKILFIGHDASRTGAPLLLLELIKWLKSHFSMASTLLLKRSGEIEDEYQKVLPTRCFAVEYEKIGRSYFRRVLRKLQVASFNQTNLDKLYPAENYPLIYANTIDTCDLAMQMMAPGRRILQHIHELAYTTDMFDARDILKKAVTATHAYIAASHAVRKYLEVMIGVPPEKIHVIHEFPLATIKIGAKPETRQVVRQRLGIPDRAYVVGMCGLPQWRKGTDLFVQLAMQVERQLGPGGCHFVWLGGDAKSHREALHDVAQIDQKETCHFIPAVPNPEAYFTAFDIFALTSREDPFSVAMLEASASALPIVCFAGAGGAPELVEDDAGVIVPYLDIPAMARACVELLLDSKRRQQLGENGRAKVNIRYQLDSQGPKILSVIKSAMNY